MGAGVSPAFAVGSGSAVVKNAYTDTPKIVLGDGITISGTEKPYVDETDGSFWYKQGGKFTLEVNQNTINSVTVIANGNEVLSKDFGLDGPDTYTGDFDIDENSNIKVIVAHGAETQAPITTTPEPVEPTVEPTEVTSEPTVEPTVEPTTKPTEGASETPSEPTEATAEPTEAPAEPTPDPKPTVTTPPPSESETIEKTLEVKFDADAPLARGTHTESVQNNGETYVSGDSFFNVDASDEGIGLSSIELEKFNETDSTWGKSRDLVNKQDFQIKVDGTYRVRATDTLGNTREHTFEELFDSSGKVNYVAPNEGEITHKVNGLPNSGDFYKDKAEVEVTLAKAFSRSTVITVNGEEVVRRGWDFNSDARIDKINLANEERAANGQYKIHIEREIFGGDKQVVDYTVKADLDAPTIENTAISGQYDTDNGTLYMGSNSKIEFDASDIGAGVTKVELKYTPTPVEGEAVAEDPSTVKELIGKDGHYSFVPASGGAYRLIVTDGVSHVTAKTLTELGLPSNTIVVDGVSPKINEVDFKAPDLVVESKNWYTSVPEYKFNVQDTNLKSVGAVVNGEAVGFRLDDAGYAIDLSRYGLLEGNRIDITTIATDKAGHSTERNRIIYVDANAPKDISGKIEGVYRETDGAIYSQDPLTVTVDSTDGDGTGVKTYQLVDVEGKVKVESTTKEIEIPAGEYSLVVVDGIGHKSNPIALKDLLGLKSNKFIYDGKNPVVVENEPVEAQYTDADKNKWYTEAGVSTWKITDDNLEQVKITVNGSEHKFGPTEDSLFPVDLNSVELIDGNRIDIAVEAVDSAGGITKTTKTMFIDGNAPVDFKGTLEGEFEDREDGIFAKDQLTLKSTSDDGVGTGVKTYELLDSEGTVVSEFPEGSIVLPEGVHSVVAVDNIGNKTAPVELKDLVGSKNSNITYDNKAPIVTVKDEVPADHITNDGEKWYVNAPVAKWTVQDDNLENVQITVNGQSHVVGVSENGEYSVDLKNYTVADGNRYDVNIQALDKASTVTESNSVVYVDSDAPVDLVGEVKGKLKDDPSGVYAKDVLELKTESNDGQGIGVSKYELVDSEGKLITTFADGKLSIPEGEHFVVVVDILGNKSQPVKISDLIGTQSNRFVYDNKVPVVGENNPTKPGYVDSDGNKWFVNAPTTEWKITDDNLKNVEITVNGKTEKFRPVEGDIYSVDLSKYEVSEGNRLDVTVVANDFAGSSTQVSRKFYVDSDAPVDLKSKVSGEYQDTARGVFAKDTLKLTSTAKDGVGSGVKTFQLVDAKGELVKDFADGKLDIPSGEHFVIVVDNLGNTSNPVSLSKLLGTKSNKFVYDDKAPILNEVNPDEPGYVDKGGRKWYTKAPVSNWKVADDNTKKVVINVNGTDTTYEPTDDGVYSIDLSKFAVLDGNRVEVLVTAYDYANNITKDNIQLHVDGDAPTDVKASVKGEYEDTSSGVFYKKPLKLSVESKDGDGTGIKTYQLIDSEGNVTKEFTGDITLPDGKHRLVVVDYLGNKSKPITMSELLDTKSNNFVHDDIAPKVAEHNPKEPGYVDSNDNKWYVVAPDSSWKISDVNLKNVEILVNGKSETFKPNEEGIYSVDLKKYALANGNRLTVEVVATDFAQNITRKTSVLYVDGDAPRDLQATVEGSYKDREFGVYAKDELKLRAKSNDGSGIGIKTYLLLDEKGDVVSEFSNGDIKIPEGSHSVSVIDHLGSRSKPVSLKSLLGLNTNIFLYDSSALKINVDREKSIHKNWYSDDIAYSVKFTDNRALYNGIVKVNGETVREFTSKEVQTEKTLSFNTSEVKANEDGSYNVVVEGIDAAGNTAVWNETIKIDRNDPQIDSFTFTAPGHKEGDSLTKSNDYGFFFTGATSVDIKVSDEAPSAGVKHISYTLRSDNGSVVETGTASVEGGIARVTIPNNFKGYIDANATDNVKRTGKTVHPSGVITENRNWYMNTSDIQINLADPGHRDNKNQFLYAGDTVATVPIKQGVSGIKSLQWGIGDTTLGEGSVGIDGLLKGSGFTVDSKGKNLILAVTGRLPINGNTNDMKFWIKVTDRAGYSSEADKTVSIDKDVPIIDVSYNDTNPTNYYSENRTATVTITERNFDPSDVQWNGKYGSLGNWQNAGGDTWRNTITFSEETEYNWGINYTDLAGNKGKGYESETFTVDKTAPAMSVTFDNNSVQNKKFYKNGRTATVEVVDKNFDASKVAYKGDGSLGGWRTSGDRHVASVNFGKDGDYKFAVDVTDMAGNKSNIFDSGDFTVDTTTPELTIEGVKNGVSYKKDVGLVVKSSDKFIDAKASHVTLTGRKNGKMKVNGGFNASTGSFEIKNFENTKDMDDLYTLSTKVVDLAGNEETKNVVFSVNRFGSDFHFSNEDLNGEYFQKLPSDVILTQTSVDRLDLKGFTVVVLRNGQKIEVPNDLWSIKESGGKDTNWVYTIRVKKEFFTEDGAYQVQMFSKAVDGTKESSMDQEYAFIIDGTKPEILISGVEDNQVYKSLDRDVTVEIRDLSGVDELAILLNDVEQEYEEENGVYKITLPANSERSNIFVEAKDRAGNIERVGVIDFYITASDVDALWQKSWVRWVTVAVGGILAVLLAMLIAGIIKRRKEDGEKQDRLTEAQVATSGELAETSGEVHDLNMETPLEPEVLGGGIVAGGVVEEPTGATEDSQNTEYIDEGNGETDFLDEGDGQTGHFDDNK